MSALEHNYEHPGYTDQDIPEHILAILALNTPKNLEQPNDEFKLEPVSAKTLCDTDDDPVQELLGPIIQKAGRTIIVGDTGEGKTTLALQMTKATLTGTDFLGYHGIGAGKALIVDLEQGIRSVKRALRDAQLHEREDVHLALVPDGLALDKNPQHLAELDRIIHEGGYSIVVLDPYYKAHQADEPNAERPIIDLMRILDALRARHQFALILPAHPRKEPPGSNGPRKLTIHDISGSGAVTRGAEIVLGIERVATGYARLRFLKDRDSDLPVGEAWNLIYTREHGYTRDPKDNAPARDYPTLIRQVQDHQWRTLKEWKDTIEAGQDATRQALETLTNLGEAEYAEGPPERHKNSKCWRLTSDPEGSGHLGSHESHTGERSEVTWPATPFRGQAVGQVTTQRTDPGETHPESHPPTAPDDDFPF